MALSAGDSPPVANAGPDVVVKLPKTDVTLNGRASTDDVAIVRYRWRLREGKEQGLNIEGDRSEDLRVTGLDVGEYKFSLTVVDTAGQRDTDYVSVVVEPGKAVSL